MSTRRAFLKSIASNLASTSIADIPFVPTGSLAPWVPTAANPWDKNAALHFYGRLGFGISWNEIEQALKSTPQILLDNAMDDYYLAMDGLPAYPKQWDEWMYVTPYSGPDHDPYVPQERLYQTGKMDIRLWWTELMTKPDIYLREKLVFNWANHFVVELQKNYYPKHVFMYWDCLRRYAWGNLKDMVKEIAIQPAMLLYLNGETSAADGINENFARELMELFLMGRVDRYGKPNYTQEDVRAVAQAVCGWRFWIEAPPPDTLHAYFAEYYFDFKKKTQPFGAPSKVYGMMAAKTKGLFTYEDTAIEADIIDTMFEVRAEQISWHIAEYIYHTFVSPDSTSDASISVIEEMAGLLVENNWEMKPMLRSLLLSDHFFDPTFRGAIVKSPYEYILGLLRSLDLEVDRSHAGVVAWWGVETGQWLMNPPNVRGWPGDHEWLNSSSLPKRNESVASAITLQGFLGGGYIDGHNGYFYDAFQWKDDQVLYWASKIPGYDYFIEDFILAVSEFLLLIPLRQEDMKLFLGSIGIARPGDWAGLKDAERVPVIRKVINGLFLLPQYQLM